MTAHSEEQRELAMMLTAELNQFLLSHNDTEFTRSLNDIAYLIDNRRDVVIWLTIIDYVRLDAFGTDYEFDEQDANGNFSTKVVINRAMLNLMAMKQLDSNVSLLKTIQYYFITSQVSVDVEVSGYLSIEDMTSKIIDGISVQMMNDFNNSTLDANVKFMNSELGY